MPRKLVLRMFPRVPPIFRILGKQLARLLAIHSEHEIAFFIFIFHLLFMFKLTYAGLGCSTRGAVLEQSISQSVSQSVIASDQAQWIESMHSTTETRRSLCDTKLIVNIPGKSHQKLSVQFSFLGNEEFLIIHSEWVQVDCLLAWMFLINRFKESSSSSRFHSQRLFGEMCLCSLVLDKEKRKELVGLFGVMEVAWWRMFRWRVFKLCSKQSVSIPCGHFNCCWWHSVRWFCSASYCKWEPV